MNLPWDDYTYYLITMCVLIYLTTCTVLLLNNNISTPVHGQIKDATRVDNSVIPSMQGNIPVICGYMMQMNNTHHQWLRDASKNTNIFSLKTAAKLFQVLYNL